MSRIASAEDIAADPAGAAEGLIDLAKRFREAAKAHEPRFGEVSSRLEDIARDLYGNAHRLQDIVKRVKHPIPETPNQFQIFSDMAGAKAAAKAMHLQLKKDIEKINKRLNDRMSIAAAAKKLNAIYKVGIGKKMSKYSKLGATDTEPRGVVAQVYADAAKKALGYSVSDYHPELVDDLGW